MRFQVWTLYLAVICKYIFILLCLCVRGVNAKVPVVSLSKQRNPYCLVLVGFRDEFERDFTIVPTFICINQHRLSFGRLVRM